MMGGGWIDPVEPIRQMLDEVLGVDDENECSYCGVPIPEEDELCEDCIEQEYQDELEDEE